jgi:uncharacterized membrane protein
MNFLRHYPHFIAFLTIGAVVTLALAGATGPFTATLIGFDAGAVLFLGLTGWRFGGDEPDAMRKRAADTEPGQRWLWMMALVVVAVVLMAIGQELVNARGHMLPEVWLAAATLLVAWLFANSLFALYYAHSWYLPDKDGGDRGGLDFPGEDPTPDYWDFAYFAFVLGMTFQVSDVQVTSQRLRRAALLHGLLAFVFNIGVVALSVNVAATALGG